MNEPDHQTNKLNSARDFYIRAIKLGEYGRYHQAVSEATKGIAILRALGHNDIQLAISLSNLATFLKSTGRAEEALQATEEAVAICRGLVRTVPDYRPVLAASLANQGIYLADLGRSEEALPPMYEALEVRKKLAREEPGTYRAELAISLNNLGPTLRALGRPSEALLFVQEAVVIRRELAAIDFDDYGRYLSRSLINLVDILADLQRTAEALPLVQESVQVSRRLTAINRGRYEPDLAESLEKQCRILTALRRPEELLPAVQETEKIRRRLADIDPDRFRPDLARSLTNIGAAFFELGQPTEALRPATEAVALYRQLASENPQKYTAELALALNNLGSALLGLNQAAQALPNARDAVNIRRELAEANPIHSADLAHSLVNLSTTFSTLGDDDSALSVAREAVTIYEDLALTNPDRYRSEVTRSHCALELVESRHGQAKAVSLDDPLPRWPIVKAVGHDMTESLAGPRVMTYTCQLPFPLGLADGGSYVFSAPGHWIEPESAEVFGDSALVIIRLCNIPKAADDPWPRHAHEVLKKVHNYDVSPENEPVSGDRAYEQWVTLETPDARLDTDNPRDDGFSFHRCLEVLSRYLRSHYMTFKDVRVRAITTYDVGPVVFVGAYTLQEAREWHYIRALIMHPERFTVDPQHADPHDSLDKLLGIYRQLDIHPFLASAEWYRRAEHARRYTGDNTDVILSLQISMESMLYRTWGMLMVDKGNTYSEVIEAINSKTGYRQLLVKVFPSLLGGRWDTNDADTAVGKYWKRLYTLRNEIVHGGYRPSWPEAEAAHEAYVEMREFINERIWANHKRYPRTLLAKLGGTGLRRKGWNSQWMQEFIDKASREPGFYYLAYDLAGRPN